jgi:hypothetical protein
MAQRDTSARKKRRKKRNEKQQPKHVAPLLSVPPPPSPRPPGRVTRVDATCDEANSGYSGAERLAQVFTALNSGWLVSVRLPILKEAGDVGDYVLRLAPVGGGVPTNGLLAETAVANASVPVGESPVTFTFRAPASVMAGTQYGLVLTRSGGDMVYWAATQGNACAGQGYFSRDQTGPFSPSSGDFVFTTFVSS